MFRLAQPELVIYVLPVLVGVLAGKYVERLANFCIMLAVFQVGLFILPSANSGELRPPRFLVPVFLCGRRYQRVNSFRRSCLLSSR
jgi:hypothetical protein